MHRFRTHTCGALRPSDVGSTVRLSGWVHRVRDHGHLVFVDLRDHYGITQCVAETGEPLFDAVTALKPETVVTVTGPVVTRDEETVNSKIPTGEVEVRIAALEVQNAAETLPLPVHGEHDYGEEVRLRYRFLDLRRERMHQNMVRRSAIVASIRRHMVDLGFMECHTPILTASSPEGARDFLVPSRLHPGTFYALPQAPQQFKQLVMASGFDRYFQIAPCFRDEDARADRSPGEFYQLDIEMAFVEQEDVFEALEPVMHGVFTEFTERTERTVTRPPFPRLAYKEAMLRYGTDKPDLRIPIEIVDLTEQFAGDAVTFKAFKGTIAKGGVVRGIPVKGAAGQPRSFFDRMIEYAQSLKARPASATSPSWTARARGPSPSSCPTRCSKEIRSIAGLEDGDAVFLSCDKPDSRRALRRRRAARARQAARPDRRGHLRVLLDHRLPDVRARRGDRRRRLQPQPVLHAARRDGGAGERRSAQRARLPVRHRLQRRGAIQRRDPQSPARPHGQGLRDRGLRRGRGEAPLRRAATTPSSTARRPTAASRRGSTASSCCSRTSPTSARSSCSR